MNFKDLHKQEKPLLLCNVWDVASTKVAEKLNFQALGTSSAAISNMLGYADGEGITFSELQYMVQRIMKHTSLPLSVDVEAGYGRDVATIVKNIKALAKLGVVGINIEDSTVEKERKLLVAESFSKILLALKQQLEKDNVPIFLNVRTDTFLLGPPNPIDETIKRIQLYERAGADGIFIPCIEKEEDIKNVVTNTKLPTNLMCMPNLPNFERLKVLGVKRISMGNFLFDKLHKYFEKELNEIAIQQSFNPVFL
ncbi:MAG: isocitrate lyase/phosphoenolpyruvate mutase family protein [Bacteroidota bacterium]